MKDADRLRLQYLQSTARPRLAQSGRRAAPILTIVIDQDELFRAGMLYALAAERFRILFAGDRPDDLPAEALHAPAVLLAGLGEDGEATLSQVLRLKHTHNGIRTVILGSRFQPAGVFAAIRAGVRGYLIKGQTSPEALAKSVELVSFGGIVLPQEFGEALESSAQPDTSGMPAIDSSIVIPAPDGAQPYKRCPAERSGLSSREQMILQELTQGASNKHIARKFNIAEATVKVHLKSLLRKIQVNNRTQAAMWARDNSQSDGVLSEAASTDATSSAG